MPVNKQVLLYSQDSCPPCHTAKAYFKEKGIPFTVRDVRTDPAAVRELVGKYGSRSTPTIVIGDEIIIGFDPVKIDAALAK